VKPDGLIPEVIQWRGVRECTLVGYQTAEKLNGMVLYTIYDFTTNPPVRGNELFTSPLQRVLK
jgi:hypothetical protein